MEAKHDWKSSYLEAVQETDPEMLAVRIYIAERTMESRVCALDVDKTEVDEIIRTLNALNVLKRERCRQTSSLENKQSNTDDC
jgi:hypothetical protein